MRANRIFAALVDSNFKDELPMELGDAVSFFLDMDTPPDAEVCLEEIEMRAWKINGGKPPDEYYKLEAILETAEKSFAR